MTLYAIEKAIKPQFQIIPHPTKRLQTKRVGSKERGICVMVFIGIAESFGFSNVDVSDFLDISRHEHEVKLARFSQLWSVVLRRKEDQTLGQHFDKYDLVHRKVRLTLNALNSQMRGTTLHTALQI